jgi:hypothetical protein
MSDGKLGRFGALRSLHWHPEYGSSNWLAMMNSPSKVLVMSVKLVRRIFSSELRVKQICGGIDSRMTFRMKHTPELFMKLALFTLILCKGVQCWACSCGGHTPCSSHRYEDVDFLGEVLSQKTVSSNSSLSIGGVIDSMMIHSSSYLFQIRVLESYRGSQKVGEVVSVLTGIGGGDCGYPFRIGSKYLVDAWKGEKVLGTGICSLTAPIEESEVELRVLRKITSGQTPPALTGEILRYAGPPEDNLIGRLAGISISLAPEGSGRSYNTVTDSAGAFDFADPPPGRYQVQITLPKSLSVAYTGFGFPTAGRLPLFQIENVKNGSCITKIVVAPSGSISGRIKFPNDQVVEGWVNADSVKPDGTPWNTIESTHPDSSGAYRLDRLIPGSYQIQFTSRVGFVKGDPIFIDLEDGEQKSEVVLDAK